MTRRALACPALALALATATAAALAASACVTASPDAVADDDALGAISVPLSSVGSDGQTYVLEHATFDVHGTVDLAVVPADGLTANVAVPEGDYTVHLRDGWNLALQHADGSTTAVPAELASKNPLALRVEATRTVNAPFQFVLGDDDGALVISFGVETRVGLVSGKLHVTGDYTTDGVAGHPHVDNGFTGLLGQDVDFRVRFEVTQSSTWTNTDGSKVRAYGSGPSRVVFGGDPATSLLAGALAQRLMGEFTSVQLSAKNGQVTATFGLGNSDATSYLSLAASGLRVRNASIDAQGFPQLTPGVAIQFDQGQLTLTHFVVGDPSQGSGSLVADAVMSAGVAGIFQLP